MPKTAEAPRARRTIFNYAENALAEMATVLRKDATILIRLREKMESQFSTKIGEIEAHFSFEN